MTEQELHAIAKGFAQVLREYATTVGYRLSVVEAKERGLDGKAGQTGPRGPEGPSGRDGRDAVPVPGPPGEKGADGRDGIDGLGIDDLELVVDEEKGYLLRWSNGDRVKEQPLPIPSDRGVYRPGTTYHKWAMVTAQGSLWIAQCETSERPGDGSKAWRLAVKRGRDGRDLRGGDA